MVNVINNIISLLPAFTALFSSSLTADAFQPGSSKNRLRIEPKKWRSPYKIESQIPTLHHWSSTIENTIVAFSSPNPNDQDRNTQLKKASFIDSLDPQTVTALIFAAIAFNFFVLANMGDGGIGGIVARVINYVR